MFKKFLRKICLIHFYINGFVSITNSLVSADWLCGLLPIGKLAPITRIFFEHLKCCHICIAENDER